MGETNEWKYTTGNRKKDIDNFESESGNEFSYDEDEQREMYKLPSKTDKETNEHADNLNDNVKKTEEENSKET